MRPEPVGPLVLVSSASVFIPPCSFAWEFHSLTKARFISPAAGPVTCTSVSFHAAFAPRVITPLGNDVMMKASDNAIRAEAYDWRDRVEIGNTMDIGEAELKDALKNAGQLFKRLQAEMEESGIHTYPPGPWHAGLEPFPAS